MSPQYKVIAPSTRQEFETYYRLRWEVLRKPWGQPPGSERDNLEEASFHFMAEDEKGIILGTCRLHIIDEKNAQIRFMAVHRDYQGKGVGKSMIMRAENLATGKGIKYIQLQSRENAIGFYEKQGYKIQEKSFLLYNEIQHFLMQKELV